uniref:Fat storage-inducing transmembrane protein 1 homolog n=1 Tax=Xiphophorus couchianus TaxID=32473 RepID=A0A3B5LFN3_9TELE
MEPNSENSWTSFGAEVNLEKLQKVAAELILPGRFLLRPLSAALGFVTRLLAWVLGCSLVRRHFHLMLSGLVLFGPLLSFWVYVYVFIKFLRSTWGWTCILTGSFVALLSFSARRSVSLTLRHLSRIGLAGLLWWGCRRLLTLLEDAAGACYEPLPLLLLHEDQSKASCLKANMMWRGYEVSQETLVLCLCCLLLVEELSVFGLHLAQERRLHRSPSSPLGVLFLLCVVLLIIWMVLLLCLLAYFPAWPSQQLGGALGYLGWRGLYQGWYQLTPSQGSPGLPGEGLFTGTDSDKHSQ